MTAVEEAREAALDEVEAATSRLRDAGRAALGISGEATPEPFFAALRRHRLSLYALVALGLLAIVDQFQSTAVYILGPEISRTLGFPKAVIGVLASINGLALTLAALPMAFFVERKPRRAVVAVSTGILWSLAAVCTGFVTNLWALFGVVLVDGTTSGSVQAVHQPLLADAYPPSVRVRVFSQYQNFVIAGGVLAPLLVYLLTGPLDLTWRGTLLVMGLTCCGVALVSLGLRDPGFGRWDAARLRQAARQDAAEPAAAQDDDALELGFFEITRRLMMIPTIRRVLFSNAILGLLAVPLSTFFIFFLEERWHMGPSARALFIACLPVTSIALIAVQSRYGEKLFHTDPARLFRLSALLQVIGIVALGMSIASPSFVLMAVLFGVATACFLALVPLVNTAYLSIVRPRMRPHASALSGIFLAGVGGILGALLLGSFSQRYGTTGALLTVLPFGVLSAVVLATAGGLVNRDLDRTVEEIVEEEELSALRHRGVRLPMLACRRIDFSYDQLQVLFDVDFTVDDGEIVALLGTNGAGKSTLLRVISGLGLPTSGSVRFRGADITYVDAERRVGLGITQVPGGRSVFGPMTVIDNLRVFGHILGRDRRTIESGIEASFAAFPRLAERRNQQAASLSGGEQQMLGLAKALILRPRLLLIDELSLGLAPKVVADLLHMVRVINASGTAVVLVEQSVNIALSLVEHAYFMEKGEIRFDGRASDLLARPDLLRSVFLEGVAHGAARSQNGHAPGPLSSLT